MTERRARLAHTASMGGVVCMTQPITLELARGGILNLTIAPGIFSASMLFGMPKEVQNALAVGAPARGRLGTPHDCSRLLRHIIEDSTLNGEVIRLEGAIRLVQKYVRPAHYSNFTPARPFMPRSKVNS